MDQIADMWSRPHALLLAVGLYAVGYAMCAGSKNITTFVAGQVIYTLGNSGITFRESSISEVFVLATLAYKYNSQQFEYRRHHVPAVASIRQRRYQSTLRRQRICWWFHHTGHQRLQCRWMAMGCEHDPCKTGLFIADLNLSSACCVSCFPFVYRQHSSCS